MSQIKALIAGLVQNPDALKTLIQDPRACARLSGITESDLRNASSVASTVSAALKRLSCKNGTADAPSATTAVSSGFPGAIGPQPACGQGVAIAATVSLLAVTGALAVLGTVSMVALAGCKDDRTV